MLFVVVEFFQKRLHLYFFGFESSFDVPLISRLVLELVHFFLQFVVLPLLVFQFLHEQFELFLVLFLFAECSLFGAYLHLSPVQVHCISELLYLCLIPAPHTFDFPTFGVQCLVERPLVGFQLTNKALFLTDLLVEPVDLVIFPPVLCQQSVVPLLKLLEHPLAIRLVLTYLRPVAGCQLLCPR